MLLEQWTVVVQIVCLMESVQHVSEFRTQVLLRLMQLWIGTHLWRASMPGWPFPYDAIAVSQPLHTIFTRFYLSTSPNRSRCQVSRIWLNTPINKIVLHPSHTAYLPTPYRWWCRTHPTSRFFSRLKFLGAPEPFRPLSQSPPRHSSEHSYQLDE